MQANKSLNRSGGWARNLNLKVAGRRPVSFGVMRQNCLRLIRLPARKFHREQPW